MFFTEKNIQSCDMDFSVKTWLLFCYKTSLQVRFRNVRFPEALSERNMTDVSTECTRLYPHQDYSPGVHQRTDLSLTMVKGSLSTSDEFDELELAFG